MTPLSLTLLSVDPFGATRGGPVTRTPHAIIMPHR